jgi:hypothetical protein
MLATIQISTLINPASLSGKCLYHYYHDSLKKVEGFFLYDCEIIRFFLEPLANIFEFINQMH